MRPAIRAVILDLDDTLYAERSYFESGLAALAAFVAGDDPVRRRACHERLVEDVARHGRRGAIDRIPAASGCSAEGWLATLLNVYRTHRPVLAAFPDVDDFIAGARRQALRLSLVTDGKSCVQWRKIEALGLRERLDVVVCSDDIDRPKPAVEPFLAAAALAGVSPESCVYIADDPSKDFIGPHRLGMDTIHVRRGLTHPLARPAPSAAAEARHQVASLAEAAQLIGGSR
jgi:putative hydrolase of the HAD superfamily